MEPLLEVEVDFALFFVSDFDFSADPFDFCAALSIFEGLDLTEPVEIASIFAFVLNFDPIALLEATSELFAVFAVSDFALFSPIFISDVDFPDDPLDFELSVAVVVSEVLDLDEPDEV